MKSKIRFTLMSAIYVLSVGCNQRDYSVMDQFLGTDEDDYTIAYCVVDVHTDFGVDTSSVCNEMKCFTSARDLYVQLCDSSKSEIQFRKEMAKKSKKKISTYIRPSVYRDLENHRIKYDAEFDSLYSEKGIAGVLGLLSTRQLYDWNKTERARFEYAASLCWNHGIFFSWDMNCEYPISIWSIYGNEKLLEKYYHPAVPEEWHEVFPKQN